MDRIKRWATGSVLGCGALCAQAAAPGDPPAGSTPVGANVQLEVQAVRRELLPADGLWVGDGAALTEAGGLMLEAQVVQWRREFLRVDRVRVVGHVQDPQADGERVAALRRAQLVQQGLVAKGGQQWRYQTEVLPLAVSALSGCGGIPPAQMAQACPWAPRAVAIEVLGVRR
ncbi:MAG: hypothetical protein RL559_855 [Pseudomonadota bacterium]